MAKALIKLPPGIAGKDGPTHHGMRRPGLWPRRWRTASPASHGSSRASFETTARVWVGVFLNGRNVRQAGGLATPLADGDEIRLLPPIAGG